MCMDTELEHGKVNSQVSTKATLATLEGGMESNTGQLTVDSPQGSRVVPRPVPEEQARNPREFEFNQLRRRYKPTETPLSHGGIAFDFKLTPSDPDFPFPLDSLHCELQVPATWPERDVEGPPALKVKNLNLPRGFAINIERGWDKIVQEKRNSTLAVMVRMLDNKLEEILSVDGADTVKVVQFKDARNLEIPAQSSAAHKNTGPETSPVGSSINSSSLDDQYQEASALPPLPKEVYTTAQIRQAKLRRALETKQVEARMGEIPGYQKQQDGVVYTLPFEARHPEQLPSGVAKVSLLHLIIPLLYPLQPVRVQFVGALDDIHAEKIEDLFSEKSKTMTNMNLMSLLNWLSSYMGRLSKEVLEQDAAMLKQRNAEKLCRKPEKGKQKVVEEDKSRSDDQRSHIKVIPRPPEWMFPPPPGVESQFGENSVEGAGHAADDDNNDEGEDFDDEEDVEYNSDLSESDMEMMPDLDIAKGTAIYFPDLDFRDIELLTVECLNLQVKCERCKTVMEVGKLEKALNKNQTCAKCSMEVKVRFRRQLMHSNSVLAGFLDLAGCSALDVMPSTFRPVCAKCSSDCPLVTLSKGDTVENVCRGCHARFRIIMPGLKFQVLTAPSASKISTFPRLKNDSAGPASWRQGHPLPSRGTCEHYRRSFRWFRFNCCKHIYPCDHCHDEAESHIHEWADRMVCGFCGREGRYAPNTCNYCGRAVIGSKAGRGFWEGGKGTRDKSKMNRKERRKYRRPGGGEIEKDREREKMGL